jgi:hypothetical protein
LPREPWETVFPITWLFPILLWLAARCRPAFSAMGAFVVSITIVWTTILGIGHFGDPSLPIADRVLGAQAGILVVAFSAYFLAALAAPDPKPTLVSRTVMVVFTPFLCSSIRDAMPFGVVTKLTENQDKAQGSL